jgi:hypothetical protein
MITRIEMQTALELREVVLWTTRKPLEKLRKTGIS